MSDVLRLCLFDGECLPEVPFRTPFEEIPGLLIAGEASTWDELKEWLRIKPVDVVAVNLGDKKDQALAVVQRITETAPNCAILGVSRRTEPETIIAAMRAGCSQFVAWPVDLSDLNQALARIRKVLFQDRHTSKRVIVVGSAGGAGATTIACNLAVELGRLSERPCALVDMNLEFGDVCSTFDCDPGFTIADVCGSGVEIDRDFLSKAMHELPCHVAVMASPKTIDGVHNIVPENVPPMFELLGGMFYYVVVDMPRSYGYLNCAGLNSNDQVLVVTQPGVSFIRNAGRILSYLRSLNVNDDRIHIILNRSNSSLDRISPEDVAEHFGKPVFAMIPNDFRRVQWSLDLGQPITAKGPTSPARTAIAELARRIAGLSTDNPDEQSAGGLFSRLLGRSSKPRT
jgi:pilus assembly protein CpaE